MERRDFCKGLAVVPATGVLLSVPGCAPAPDGTQNGGAQQGASAQQGFKVGRTIQANQSLDAAAYDHVHCDQFGIDYEGRPIADHLTGTGSDAGLTSHDPDDPHTMTLTREEQDILDGSQGETMAKVLMTIVAHGELFGATHLADAGGAPHSSLYTGSPWVEPVLEMT